MYGSVPVRKVLTTRLHLHYGFIHTGCAISQPDNRWYFKNIRKMAAGSKRSELNDGENSVPGKISCFSAMMDDIRDVHWAIGPSPKIERILRSRRGRASRKTRCIGSNDRGSAWSRFAPEKNGREPGAVICRYCQNGCNKSDRRAANHGHGRVSLSPGSRWRPSPQHECCH